MISPDFRALPLGTVDPFTASTSRRPLVLLRVHLAEAEGSVEDTSEGGEDLVGGGGGVLLREGRPDLLDVLEARVGGSTPSQATNPSLLKGRALRAFMRPHAARISAGRPAGEDQVGFSERAKAQGFSLRAVARLLGVHSFV